jgi:uncharacterized protein with GYD domain
MSLYFLLGTLSTEGQRLAHQDPDLLLKATNSIDIEEATILGRYAVLGRYDYVIMVDAVDNEAVARMSVEIGVRTGLHIETLPAIAIGFLAGQETYVPVDEPESVRLNPN